MFGIKPNTLSHRILVGKFTGFLIGLAGVVLLWFEYPKAHWNLYLVVALWYATIGAVIGLAGVYRDIPVVSIKNYRYWRGAMMGGWFNFLLVLFAWDPIKFLLADFFTQQSWLHSPWWGVVEGIIVGGLLDWVMTMRAGDGPALVNREFLDG